MDWWYWVAVGIGFGVGFISGASTVVAIAAARMAGGDTLEIEVIDSRREERNKNRVVESNQNGTYHNRTEYNTNIGDYIRT